MYTRAIENQIKKIMFKGKVAVIVGARQVGKTTLLKKLTRNYETVYFNCDNPLEREALNNKDIEQLKPLVGNAKVIAIDEAQKVSSIGQTLKLMVDYYGKQKQIIATGSSAFNLLTSTEEPLTGRKRVFTLYPLSITEGMTKKLDYLKRFDEILRFGTYPEVFKSGSEEEKIDALKEISSSYLYKDILGMQEIRNSNTIYDLVRALAFQIGNEVSYTELATKLEINKKTVERYIDLLEKSYIIFKLPPYKRNRRRTIKRHNKIYFYDLGIRNAVINNFNPLKFRDDVGELFENLCIIEKLKSNEYSKQLSNLFFLRTYDGKEIDLIEEKAGKYNAYEFKLSKTRAGKKPPGFEIYEVINRDNLWHLV
jgi:hypothetical protein